MSIYDKSSLVLIPSGTKAGKVYSQKPVSGDGDFTFTRSSAATRVNADGNIEKETQNLFSGSNDLDNTSYWIHTNLTSVTGGQSGYDGSSDAFKIVENTSSGQHNIQQTIATNKVQTISVYAKAAGRNFLHINQAGIRIAYYNLSTGALGNVDSNVIDATITDIGSGWYRCTYTALMAYTNCRIGAANSNGGASYTGDGTSGVLLQDTQIEEGLVARDYIETTTSAVYGGITDNVPRLDYTDSSCPALLLEPQRTNLVSQSEYIGSLTPERGTITTNADTSPEGVVNATSFVEDSATGRHRTSFYESVTSGTTYTFSMFAKIKSGTRLLCINNLATIGARAYFDLVNGDVESIDGGSASIEDYGNGWYRCYVTATSSFTGNATTYIGLEDNTADNGYAGDGTSGHYWFGLQLEAGSYPTSYIPTYGSSVTRNQEDCNKTSVSDLIGQTEGAFFTEFKIENLENLATRRLLTLSNGNSNTRIVIYLNSLNKISIYIVDGGVAQWNYTGTILTAGTYKIAVGYATNDFVLYVNGSLEATDSAGSVPATNRIDIGNQLGSNVGEQPIKQLSVFKTRLTNAELQDLTTL